MRRAGELHRLSDGVGLLLDEGGGAAVDQNRRDRPGAGDQGELLLPRFDRHADGRQVLRGGRRSRGRAASTRRHRLGASPRSS